MKPRVVSGMRPTGKLHLGHLVGALNNWAPLQDQYDCFYFVADWHALTSDYADTSAIVPSAYDMVADWIAAGLDPAKSTLFVQSLVPEHAELFLLLSMTVPIPWLERVPTYKEQIEQMSDKDLSTLGFLGYPLLQTADVIIYNAQYVPVGEDQVPHLELSREIVRRFHNFYGELFVEPLPLLTKFPRLPGLDNRKMSKSYGNTINLSDDCRGRAEKSDADVHGPQTHPRRRARDGGGESRVRLSRRVQPRHGGGRGSRRRVIAPARSATSRSRRSSRRRSTRTSIRCARDVRRSWRGRVRCATSSRRGRARRK